VFDSCRWRIGSVRPANQSSSPRYSVHRLSIRLAVQEQVEPKVMVSAIVHHVTPDPDTALNLFDLALPAYDGVRLHNQTRARYAQFSWAHVKESARRR